MENLAHRIEWAEVGVRMLICEREELRAKIDKARARLAKLKDGYGEELVAEVRFVAVDQVSRRDIETEILNALIGGQCKVEDAIARVDRVTVRKYEPD